jgi:hypothetical protein
MSQERRAVVIAHFDVHGVAAGYLASKVFNAAEVYSNFPQTAPEQVVQTIQNLYAASPQRLHIVLIDIPIDLKNPVGFVQGLEQIAAIHDVTLIDHHESSVRFAQNFQRVRFIYVGPSALTLNNYLLSQIQNATDADRIIALVGAVGDRDAEVVKQGLLTRELQEIADGLDVLVRERDGALKTVRALLQNPQQVLEEARQRSNQIPTAQLDRVVGGVVAVAAGILPEQWGPKALEKVAFAQNTWYAVGVSRDPRTGQYVVRAILRWDVQARYSNLPTPGAVARRLWATRNIIGHPAAPSVAATSEEEAREMTLTWARAIADEVSRFGTPQTLRFINEYEVGRILAEVLLRLEQVLERQTQMVERQEKMYAEYLELKRRQVELLERGERRAAD